MLLSPFQLRAQKENNIKEKYIWFDNLVGQLNSGIFKGESYINEYRVVNDKYQFFARPDFSPGSVSYKDQIYFDVPLKYDVYHDNLLAQNLELLNRPVMVLERENIAEFTIDGCTFRYISDATAIDKAAGFFEVLLKDDYFTLYKKNTKKIYKRTDEKTLYYEFTNDYYYLLHLGDAYYQFKKVKELSRIFSEYRKDLKVIAKRYESMRKLDTDGYLKAILIDLRLAAPMEKEKAL